MKNVMITGGAGFIGSNYVRLALETHPDWQVTVLDKMTYAGNLDNLKDLAAAFKNRYKFVQADIADRESVFETVKDNKIDILINFAADTHVDRSLFEPGQFIMTDVFGTYVLLEAAKEFKIERYHQISSVTGDTPLLVKNDRTGDIRLRPIEDLEHENFNDLSVLTMKADHKVDFQKMKHFIKHPVDELYEITYNGGGHIRATATHSVFVFTESGILAKPSSELKEGDYLVTFVGQGIENRQAHTFDVRELMAGYAYEGMEQAAAKRERILQFVSSGSGAKYANVRDAVATEIGSATSFRVLEKLAAEGALQKNAAGMYVADQKTIEAGCAQVDDQWWQLVKNKLHISKDTLTVTPELMEVFGLYLAEGHCAHTETELKGAGRNVVFTIGLTETRQLQLLKDCAKNTFGIHATVRQRESTFQISYNSRWVHALFAQFGATAETKQLPTWIWTQPTHLIEAFLRGYEGDAAIKSDGRRVYTSVNPTLIQNLLWLARLNNINCLMNERTVQQIAGQVPPGATVTRKRKFYDLQVTSDYARAEESGTWRTPMARCLPSEFVINTLGARHHKGKRIHYKPLVGKARALAMAHTFDNIPPHLEALLNSPIGVAKVKSIRRIKGDFMVYDVSVPGNEKFFGGNVPCLLHNTDEVYGDIPEPERTPETWALNPSSPYSASKTGGDVMCLAYHRSFGVPVTITRGTNNIGPYQYPEKAVPLFVTNLIDNLTIPLYGDGSQMRDYQFVGDHCEGIDAVIAHGIPGEVYNVGSGVETRNIEMVHAILDILKKPKSMIQPVKDRPGHDKRYAIDNSKVRALGWKPSHTFEQALEKTVKWYVDNEWWWRKIKTGEYMDYYKKQYAGREIKN